MITHSNSQSSQIFFITLSGMLLDNDDLLLNSIVSTYHSKKSVVESATSILAIKILNLDGNRAVK